jgi:uncharacterized damage-inducible protein DinB
VVARCAGIQQVTRGASEDHKCSRHVRHRIARFNGIRLALEQPSGDGRAGKASDAPDERKSDALPLLPRVPECVTETYNPFVEVVIMRMSHLVKVAAGTILAAAMAQSAAAQVPAGVGEGWLGEFDHASRQLLQLAEATPADKFAWRPAAGVRSIAEVYMHIAIANQYLLSQAGAKPSVDLAKLGKEPEKSISDKAGVIEFLKESFDAVRSGYQSADRQKKVQLFKKDVTVGDVFLRILVHNNEHMGQSVAYARMNGITPPWSAARGQ